MLVGEIQASAPIDGLIGVQVAVNIVDCYALVDSGASNNFVADRMMVALGL